MKNNWPLVLKRVLVHEGGYDNDPRDPGGVTLNGILQREYDKYRIEKGLPIRAMSAAMQKDPTWIAERDDIYRTKYADTVRFDELPAGLDYTIVDGGINSGPVQAVKWTQRELPGIVADGHIGNETMQAILAHPDYDKLIIGSLLRRQKFLEALKTFQYFGKGWTRRVNEVRAVATAMASGSVLPASGYEQYANKKAAIEDAKPVVIKDNAGVIVGGTTGAAGGTTLGAPYNPYLALAIAAGVLVIVGGIVYLNYRHNKKAKALADALGVGELDPNEKPLSASL